MPGVTPKNAFLQQESAKTNMPVTLVDVALTELLNWTYTLDGVLDTIWRKRLDPAIKEKASLQVTTPKLRPF